MLLNQTLLFNELLSKELDNNKNKNSQDNICLITNEPLNKSQIKLFCGHSFNFKALFKEVSMQKCVVNNKETQRLGKHEFKCPYCRTIQKGLLPLRKGYKEILFVNSPVSYAIKVNKCKYSFLSGKKKGMVCNKDCSGEYCFQHMRIIEKRKKKQEKTMKNEVIQNEVVQNEVVQNEVVQNEVVFVDNNIGDTIEDNTNLLNSISFNLNGKHTDMLQNIIESLQDDDFGDLEKYELLANDSNFIKNKLFYIEWISNNIQPVLHNTKKESYFRCRCEHIINKGTKNERRCKKYVVCSKKKKNNPSQTNKHISPKFYMNYLCSTHCKKEELLAYSYPMHFYIDLVNIPKEYRKFKKHFSKYLNLYYHDFYHSPNYKYKKFSGFKKKNYLCKSITNLLTI